MYQSAVAGPGWSKLTTSLVNVSLNFQKLISQLCQYFFFFLNVRSFCTLIFSTKNIGIFIPRAFMPRAI